MTLTPQRLDELITDESSLLDYYSDPSNGRTDEWCLAMTRDKLEVLRAYRDAGEDARRYKMLRGDPLTPPNNPFEVLQWLDSGPRALHGEQLDAAVDAAMGKDHG